MWIWSWLDSVSGPASIGRRRAQLKFTIVETGSRLRRSPMRPSPWRHKPPVQRAELFRSIRIRSLDPLVQFDATITPGWKPTKISMETVWIDDETSRDLDVIVHTVGPMPLPIRIDRRLMNAGNPGIEQR